MSRTPWKLEGEELACCNCAWGCPCQFNALPTDGHCDFFAGFRIDKGHFGDTAMDGALFAMVGSLPGAPHEGNGRLLLIVDENATPAQRTAIEALWTGHQGGAYFEIYSSILPNRLGTLTRPITFSIDRQARQATLSVPGVGESSVEPIKNPVTGAPHRASIQLPEGFEYQQAEMGNTVSCRVDSHGLSVTLENSYAQLNRFAWGNA